MGKFHNMHVKYGRMVCAVTPADIAAGGGTVTVTPEDAGDEEPPAGDDDAAAPKLNEFGYPDDTKVEDMTQEQQIAYWKRCSRKHEAAEKALLKQYGKPADQSLDEAAGDVDEDNDDSDGESPATDNDSVNEEPDPIDEARREGENIGAEKYLRLAVGNGIRAELKGVLPDDAIKGIIAVIDPHAFLKDDGDLDSDLIRDTFKNFAPQQEQSRRRDPAAWAAGHHSSGSKSAGSVKEKQDRLRKQIQERNTKGHRS